MWCNVGFAEIELNCNTKEMVSNSNRDATDFPDCMGTDDPCNPVGSELVTYRFAAILTEDVTNNQADSTLESGLTWLAAMINQANLLTIRDFSFKLQICCFRKTRLVIEKEMRPKISFFRPQNLFQKPNTSINKIE